MTDTIKKVVDNYRRTPINPERMTLKQAIRTWGHNVLIGKFHLKVKVADAFRVAGGVSAESAKATETSETLTNPKEFAILLNNMDRTPNFTGSEQMLEFIDCLYQVGAFDAEASRTRIFIETHFYPTQQQKERIRENIDSFNMIQMIDYQFGLWRRFNGIAYNTSKKEERHNVKEIEMVEEQFEKEYNLIKDGESAFRIGDLVEEEKKLAKEEEKKRLETKGEVELNLNGDSIQEGRLNGKLDLTDFTGLEELDCSNNYLTELDITACENLVKLNAGRNKLTTLDLSNNNELEEIIIYQNKIKADLDIFSHLTKIKKLFIGFRGNSWYFVGKSSGSNDNNDFSGSLEDLKDCQDLEYLNIRGQENIEGGLEELPSEKLKYFDCKYTDYEKKLEGFGGDLVNHPELISVDDEAAIALLDKKLKYTDGEKDKLEIHPQMPENKLEREKEEELEIERQHAKNVDSHYQKIIKLELEAKKALEKENKELKERLVRQELVAEIQVSPK
ncbi:30867_t:CDS:2 [Racocetra persica]|uniref:30867_t:CDS:1 n=1 Tax=Racocetra persica TaxID=160502 RepID=A0ACA9LES9_9GLOM|nr:30867_t:CDS:2 [Racocetra persica]